ncbi:MAG: mannose-1-phosphate guanylyltransferase [Bacteroidota bacterium]|nr:mannose-1-phosphate guanylyltransferase [Bacteroidota bacterium]
MNQNSHAVIMAGGIGSRFWPMSRNQKPKQFLDVLGTGKSLIQLTYERLSRIIPQDNIWVVTHKDYKDLTVQNLPHLNIENLLLEPERKNTAPCIMYAANEIKKRNPSATMLVAPADHLILNEIKFVQDVEEGISFIEKEHGLLTLGIQVSRPDTGYGYIHFDQNQHFQNEIFNVLEFVEKPDHNTALKYMEDGNYLWNSGMFLWEVSSILEAIKKYSPEIHEAFTNNESSAIDTIYAQCANISIDYAVMEKADKVIVKRVDFGWSDLGTWGSLSELIKHDEFENAVVADKCILNDSRQCMIHDSESKLIAIQGLHDFIVVNTKEVLLICKKSQEQEIKKMVSDTELKLGKDWI